VKKPASRSLTVAVLLSALTLLFLLGAIGCNNQSRDVLGIAYIAPGTLNLRREITRQNNTVAVLKHGEAVQILDVRRRFVKVRTYKGVEGWIDSAQLLTPEQMNKIRQENQVALALPSEGAATAYEPLNIHIEPSRQSAAFTKISEGESVEVLAHKIEPKVTGPVRPPTFTFERPQAPVRKDRKERRPKNGFRLPPKPPPPKPPENGQELSAARVTGTAEESPEKKEPPKTSAEPTKPVVMEDWTLVRTKDRQCGWVLSRNLTMSIPDEVAQYAEGKRITSYFDLGAVQDEEKGVKHNWLWTTSSDVVSYDFDSWRVFLWNRRRHRYETSYRQRDIEGYFPVHVDPPDPNALGRTFAVITKDENGALWRSSYLFDGVRVHLTGREAYHGATSRVPATPGASSTEKLQPKPRPGWLRRKWQELKQSLSGHD
jgi:SH3-like domain-containing protein